MQEQLQEKRCRIFFFSLIAILVVGVAYFCSLVCGKSSYSHVKDIIVKSTNSDYLCNLLLEKKISNERFVIKILLKALKLVGCSSKIGEYRLPDGVSLIQAIKIFATGKSVVHKITIPEGFSVYQAINRINKNEFLLGEIEKIPEEGSLMPDTYLFQYPTTKQHIISMAQREMSKFLKKAWENRPTNCFLKTPQEALILASIVEKETYIEREMVAGVYTRRLKNNMRMQAEPTAVYAITHGAPLGREINGKELRMKLPHNTYTNKGLPPTPISNPSRASILAAINPTDTDYLFFVLDDSSLAHFAKTFDEHKQNIKKIKKQSEAKKSASNNVPRP